MGVSASRSREVCRECKDVCVACGGGACVWTCVTPATCSEPQFEYVITPTDHGAVVQVQPAFPPKFELEAAWKSGCRDERRRQSECVKAEGESLVIGSKQTVYRIKVSSH